MIRHTKEFKDFAGLVEDSGGAVRSLKTNDHQQAQGGQAIKIEENNEEDADWVPEPAFSLAHNFKRLHGNELTTDLVNSLLSDLNKIWRDRERKQLARIKNQCREELNTLKRQLSFRTSYDQLVSKKTVAHMKTQIKHQKQNQSVRGDLPAGLELVDNTLQLVTAMQAQRKELESKIEKL